MAEMRHRGFCTLCRSRCGAIFVTRDGLLKEVLPDPEHPTGGALCAKGRAAPEILADRGRLTRPLRRTRPKGDPDPGWEPVSWDEALADIAGRLSEIRDTHGPDAASAIQAAALKVMPRASAKANSSDSLSTRWRWSMVQPVSSPTTM